MLENGKVSPIQFMILVLTFTLGSTILVVPAALATVAKQDAWIVEIIDIFSGLILVTLYNRLAILYLNMTFVEYSELVLSRWVGKICSLLYLFYFFILSSLLIREIGDFLTTMVMPETPIQAINILFLLPVILAVRYGIEIMARSSQIFIPWVIFLFLILSISLIPEIEFNHIQPIFENGLKPIILGTVTLFGNPWLELVAFLMIFPYVNNKKEAKKSFIIGALIGGVILLIISFLTILVLGVDATSKQNYPSYTLAKKINIGDFFQRIEALMAGLWFITIFTKLTVCFYVLSLGLAQFLKLKNYRSLTSPLGIILLVMSLVVSPNIVYFNIINSQVWYLYSLTIGLLLPLLVLGVGVLRKKGLKLKGKYE